MASTKLTRTFGSGGNRLKWTWSGWVKRSGLGSAQAIFTAYENANNHTYCRFDSDDELRFEDQTSGNTNGRLVSNMKFRDTNFWYHLVLVFDKNNSTSGDRIKMYVNGERITSFSETGNAPFDTGQMNNESLGREHEIGCFNNTAFFNGLMSHIHFCDGYAYLPSDFGETDSTTGEWKIKTSPSVSYGTTGYWILKDGNSVTDSSTNSNAWTVGGGTLTKTEDNPSNVFATYNFLIGNHSNGNTLIPDMSNGNLDAWRTDSTWRIAMSSLAASSGKYYAEFKQSNDYGTDYAYIGIWDIDAYAQKPSGYPYMADMANCFGLYNGNGNVWSGSSDTSYGVSYAQNDIIGCAMDLDNNKIYWSKNGTWMNSANPSSGTGGYSITANKTYAMGVQLYNNAFRANFGNGYFATTEITTNTGTGYQDADGNGRFYYAVPTNFRCLSTKGLNQ